MTDRDDSKLEAKLDVLIRLFAIGIATGEGTLKDRAVKLSRAGLGSREIAELCDTTPNTVSVALSKAKSEKKNPEKGKPNAKE